MELADYLGVLRRRWPTIALGLLLGTLLAGLTMQVVPKTYTATASVIVLPTIGDTSIENGRTSQPINLDTEAQIVTSYVVASGVADALGAAGDPGDLVRKVSVSVPPNTSVLDISYSASSAEDARNGAQAFAMAYLDNRGAAATAQLEDAVATLRGPIAALNVELREASAKLATLSRNSPEATYLVAQKNLLIQQISALSAELVPLTSGDVEPGRIISDARAPSEPSNPSPSLLLATGLFGGLLLGLVGAAYRERRDHRIRGHRDLATVGLSPLVGRAELTMSSGAPPAMSAPDGDAFQLLRNALAARVPYQNAVIVVAPASDSESGAFISRNLALTVAHSGVRTLLVSLTTTSPEIGMVPRLAPRGLGDVLAFDCALSEALRAVPRVPNLHVLSAGVGTLPSTVLQDAAAEAVFSQLREMYDVVLIDVPPVTKSADAQTLARNSDGVLLVATLMHTVKDELVEAVGQFAQVGAVVLGCVAVRDARGKGRRRVRRAASGAGETPQEPVHRFPELPKRSGRGADTDSHRTQPSRGTAS